MKKASSQTEIRRDSTTVITQRPITVHMPADSLRDSLGLQDFTTRFHAATVGTVIQHATSPGKRVRYTLRKTSQVAFTVEAHATHQDTTVTATDTQTTVRNREKTKEVLVAHDGPLAGFWHKAKDSLLWLLLALAILATLRLWLNNAKR